MAFFAILSFLSLIKNAETGKEGKEIFDENVRQNDPYILFENRQEQSFATQLQTTVRAPFGPNPQQKYINDMSLLKKEAYQEAYQRNIRNNQDTGTQYWRIDPLFNSELNNYADFHMPEATIPEIQKYHHKRRLERTGK
jgi:hypothetical protein